MSNNNQPIIIKKKKGGEHGHHGGAWKVAYADFVTAMMALFIVLWVLGQDESTKESVAHYFRDPVGFSDKGKTILVGYATGIQTKDPEKMAIEEKQKMQAMGEKILSEMESNSEFMDLKDKVKIEFIDEGMRIEIIESADNVFFEVGTSQLKPEAVRLLVNIGNQLATLPNKIIIEGHTDSRPYSNSGRGYTNFELSSDRANSARNALTMSNLNPGQIDEVRGYADRRLRDKDDPFSLVNRRISIIVKYGNKK